MYKVTNQTQCLRVFAEKGKIIRLEAGETVESSVAPDNPAFKVEKIEEKKTTNSSRKKTEEDDKSEDDE